MAGDSCSDTGSAAVAKLDGVLVEDFVVFVRWREVLGDRCKEGRANVRFDL